jgi:LysM repeat protein
MRRTAIVAVAVVLAGCSGAPAPTPIIIYVTPAPTPTVSATAQPTATSPPPTQIPAIVTPEPSPTPIIYVVVAGDMLSAIAKKYGLTLAELLQANPQIKDPNRILVGDRITIPPKSPPTEKP